VTWCTSAPWNRHDQGMGFPQRLLADDEKLVLVLRRHVKVLLGPFLLFVLGLVALGLTAWLSGANPIAMIVVAVIVVVVLARWAMWPFLVWYNTVYAITTRRLILRNGVLNRSGHDMPLSRLNDVSFSHNLLERMLGCGTLVVESGGELGQLKLDDVPKVELVQRTLYRLSEDLRGVVGGDDLDPSIARSLDDAFDDEYRGPAGTPADHRPADRSGDQRS
jgi:membrane protein YdbS with pleckstrin-like domain